MLVAVLSALREAMFFLYEVQRLTELGGDISRDLCTYFTVISFVSFTKIMN
ncbi:unnamed protein product [marine sediment metagenome]|uniref:Uncharacterized protein n=1 Tax=marine sediment metagenome TaxID=412755 RepID=X1T381_9ZZZZ